MTYPAGVQLSTLTFSNPTTFLGNQATRTEVTVQASAGVVWAATGEPIDDFSETVAPNEGLPGTLTVPFVDQPGFTDQSGNAFTMWAYTVTRRTFFGASMKVVQKIWQPVVGQDVMDFDNLPGGDIGLPVSAPIAPVTSVAGETGAVGADALADALAGYLPIPDVSGKLDASEKGVASGVATLDSGSKVPAAQIPNLSATYAAKSVETSKLDASTAATTYAAKSVETTKLDASVAATTYAAKSVETSKLDVSQKGAASGVAALDAAAKVPIPQIPAGLPVDQLDYVQALAARSKSTKLQLKKNGSTNEVEVSCLTPSGSHVTYQFYGSAAGDDYRVLANVWCGTSTAVTSQVVRKLWADVTTTGTYTAAAAAFVYTTDKVTPATFTATVVVDVDGSDLRFHTYRDNRGGQWELKITGPVSQTANFSTYAATAAYNTTGITVLTNLRPGTYTVVGKFLGDDPLNVPSGGAGTARGWLANNADATSSSATLLDVYAPFRQVNKDILLKPASNMDIAMQVKPAGGATLEWMPYHGVATMYLADAPVYLDGDAVIDVASMAIGQYRALSSFELVQRVNGRNSTSGATNLVELATSHLIRATGQVTVTGRWKALVDIELGDNYHMMFPASMALFDKLVTSIGNAYRNGTDLIGLETNLVAENDTAMSYLFLASGNKSIAGAARFNNVQETIRRGKPNKNPDTTKAFLQHRDASIVKVYNRPYLPGTAIPTGTVNRFGGDYIYTQGLGLYDQFAV